MRYYGWFDCGKEGYIDVAPNDMDTVAEYFRCHCDHCIKNEFHDEVVLQGTPKQVVWAKKIRADFIQHWQRQHFKEMKHILEKETEAKYWIEARDKICEADFMDVYFLDPSSIEFQWRKLDQPQIINALEKHDDDFVLIEKEEAKIWLYYDGNDATFSHVVKKARYQFEQHSCAPCFRAKKTMSKSGYDEVLTIAKLLLARGFNVVVPEPSIFRRLTRCQKLALSKQLRYENKKTTQLG